MESLKIYPVTLLVSFVSLASLRLHKDIHFSFGCWNDGTKAKNIVFEFSFSLGTS